MKLKFYEKDAEYQNIVGKGHIITTKIPPAYDLPKIGEVVKIGGKNEKTKHYEIRGVEYATILTNPPSRDVSVDLIVKEI